MGGLRQLLRCLGVIAGCISAARGQPWGWCKACPLQPAAGRPPRSREGALGARRLQCRLAAEERRAFLRLTHARFRPDDWPRTQAPGRRNFYLETFIFEHRGFLSASPGFRHGPAAAISWDERSVHEALYRGWAERSPAAVAQLPRPRAVRSARLWAGLRLGGWMLVAALLGACLGLAVSVEFTASVVMPRLLLAGGHFGSIAYSTDAWATFSRLLMAGDSAPAALAATWRGKDFDSTLGYPGEGPLLPGTPLGARRVLTPHLAVVELKRVQLPLPTGRARSLREDLANSQRWKLDFDEAMAAVPPHPSPTRWHCPVAGCPCADPARHQGWANAQGLHRHLDAHLSGQLAGQVDPEWLRRHGRARCRVCGLSVGANRGVHPACRPADRAALRVAAAPQPVHAAAGRGVGEGRPSLASVHAASVPTLRYVPKRARAAWSRALTRCLAGVVARNSVAAWTDLQMLAKTVLSVPPRTGRDHESALAAFTLERLARWEAGERQSLWQEACDAQPGRRRRPAGPPTAELRAARATAYAAEGLLAKGCAALTAQGLAEQTRETVLALERLHPRAPAEPLGHLDSLLAAPELAPNAVLKALRAFPKGTAPGPSGLRAQHLLDALTPATRATVCEQLAAVFTEAFTERRATKVALLLLRHCASFGKLVYCARTAPPELQAGALRSFDAAQRASRGLAYAGLGLRRLEAHAAGACLASLGATRRLCSELDPAYSWAPEDAGTRAGAALSAHNAQLPQSAGLRPGALETAKQKDLSAALDDYWHRHFLENLGAADRADIQSELPPGASGFLEVAPSEKLGLLFEPEEFLTELRRRLLMPVYDADHFCPCCDEPCDRHGRCAGLCAGAGDRVCRHNAARNLVGRFAAAAGCNPELERPGLLPPRPGDDRAIGRRPADVYIPSWHLGAPAAFDFAVSSPHRQAARGMAFQGVGSAAEAYEVVKRTHLDTE
ncbi:unnamed protein product, partial [Prorocentrum cordatum]